MKFLFYFWLDHNLGH